MQINVIKNKHGIYTVDAGYQSHLKASIHIVVEGDRAILYDSGINNSVALLKNALDELGLGFDKIDYLFLTHVHLDHAGGAGFIMQNSPNAKLIIHPRGARHMIDPSRLMVATKAVYGEEKANQLYGELIPVPDTRIIITENAQKINWQNREILIIDTPGHARHHNCYYDSYAKAVFTGDTFGLSYRQMDEPQNENSQTADTSLRQFIYPTTTPTQFEPECLINSIKTLLALSKDNDYCAFLTHFGQLRNLPEKAESLIRQINNFVNIANKHKNQGENRYKLIRAELEEYLLVETTNYNSSLSKEKILQMWKGDLDLNAQGIVSMLDNQNKSR